MAHIFRIPRWPDRQLIEILSSIASDLSIPNPSLYFIAFEGATPSTIGFADFEKNATLQPLLAIGGEGIHHLALLSGGAHLLKVTRKGDSLFDEATMDWQGVRSTIQEPLYARLIGVAKQKLKEVKISEVFSGFPNAEINGYYEARDATLTRLEAMSRELLYGIHERQKELDKEYANKIQELELKTKEERSALQKEFESRKLNLLEKEEAFSKKEAEFETRDSKYLRRQLRQDMLKKLADLSQKFELTKGTRRLRWPIMGFTMVFVAFFAVLTVLAFTQTVQILNSAGSDMSKLNWWILGLFSMKQLAYASAFIAGSWFLIRWNDRWFRQHADAEFGFKQLELDINRASWVVEMALEWKAEKGTEIPPELLDRLTQNLFKETGPSGGDSDSPPDLASVILGSASSLRLKAGNGTEVELDRRGIKSAMKES